MVEDLNLDALIIAEDGAVRDSLHTLLEAHGVTARAFPGAAECLATVASADAAQLVVTLQATGDAGLEIHRRLSERGPVAAIVILAERIHPASRAEADRVGAILVESPPLPDTVSQAIEAALATCRRQGEGGAV